MHAKSVKDNSYYIQRRVEAFKALLKYFNASCYPDYAAKDNLYAQVYMRSYIYSDICLKTINNMDKITDRNTYVCQMCYLKNIPNTRNKSQVT